MPPVKNRTENPSPQIAYAEVDIPDSEDLGTGRFIVFLKSEAMKTAVVGSNADNPPSFQISMTIHEESKGVLVSLGKVDGSSQTSRKLFVLPGEIDKIAPHTFVAIFSRWKVVSVEVDGRSLRERLNPVPTNN